MENKELLLHLVKKLESGELVLANEDEKYVATEDLFLKDKNSGQKVYIGTVETDANESSCWAGIEEYKEGKNEEFKENFYQEKGLDKCWVKNCPNKILQKEADYKKIKALCKEKHTRMVCLSCAEMDAIQKLAEGENDDN